MSATHLYLLRHAEVEEQFHRTFGGSGTDMALSPTGHDQAACLAGWLRNLEFDAAYLSPMQRVQLTAQPWLAHHRGSVTTLPDLREVHFGSWTGLTWHGVHEKFGVSAFDWLHQLDTGFPEGEDATRFTGRLRDCLDRILAEQHGRKVAVFCHGGVVRGLLSILLDLPLTRFEAFEVDYASCTWVTVGESKAGRTRNEVQLLNFTPWRDL